MVESDARIVGFAITGPSRDPDASTQTAEVGAIYVRSIAARMGIGHALLDHGINDVRQRGFDHATLWVLEQNDRARRFYEKDGWSADGETKIED